jgi:hypothetical protein
MAPFARIALLAGLITASVSVLTGSASAGGAPLHFDQKFYVPGDVAVGHTEFGAGSVGLKGLDRGPYFAYLLPRSRSIDPPHIPQGAIRVGEVQLIRDADDGFRATLSFVVPDVRAGIHAIEYCNDPCRVASVGELWGGAISVYESGAEARLDRLLTSAEHRLSRLRDRLEAADRREAALEEELAGERSLQEALSDRMTELQAELDAARSAEGEPTTPFGLIGWLLFAATALLWVGRSLTRVRRRRTPPAPSIPPQERVEERSPRELEPVG